MGLPKNYQKQNRQLSKRFESLKDLNYYKVKYEFRFTKDFRENQIETYDWGTYDSEWGVPQSSDKDSKYSKTKRFSAFSDEQAENKIVEWLDSQVEKNIISEYNIISTDKQNFYDVLEEKGLLFLVNQQ